MNTTSDTVTVWQSGRLAPQIARRRFRFEFGREQGLIAALLALCAGVLAIYVGVLQRDVDRSELVHAAQRAQAAVEARCVADQPGDQRGRCIALANGDVDAVPATPDGPPNEQDNAARAATLSLLAHR